MAEVEAKVLYNKVAAFTNKKPISRKRIQKGGELTSTQAQALIDERDRKEAQKQAIAELKALQKVERDAQRQLHELGVLCHRGERIRKRELR